MRPPHRLTVVVFLVGTLLAAGAALLLRQRLGVDAQAHPDWPSWVFALGMACNALVTGLLWQQAAGRQRAEALARGMAAELAQLKAHIAELVEARREAELAHRAQSEFIASISHELRTPLQSVIGFSELGAHFAQDRPQLVQMFGDTLAGGRRMLALVNGLLDVARIEDTSRAASVASPTAETAPVEEEIPA